MATITAVPTREGLLARPVAPTGLWSWLTTVDHKRIGLLYGSSAFLFFLVGTDFWVIGLQMLGVASVAAALNFLITIIQLRAPGMSLMRMPLFTWTTFITSILLVLAFPVIAIALVELMFDRLFATNSFTT